MKDFFNYYQSLPSPEKTAFRKRIVAVCGIEPPTWYSWMRRGVIPKPSQKLIALELGRSIDELFPEADRKRTERVKAL